MGVNVFETLGVGKDEFNRAWDSIREIENLEPPDVKNAVWGMVGDWVKQQIERGRLKEEKKQELLKSEMIPPWFISEFHGVCNLTAELLKLCGKEEYLPYVMGLLGYLAQGQTLPWFNEGDWKRGLNGDWSLVETRQEYLKMHGG